MADKNTAAFGIYPTYASVGSTMDALRAAGFRQTDVSVLFPENIGSKDLGIVKASKAPEGAAAGAALGVAIGGALGWLVGMGVLVIPNLGQFVAAGPIVSMLAGVGAGSALGVITGALAGLEIPEYEARRYAGRVKNGGILLSIHCDDSVWTKRAKKILKQTGAEDVAAAVEERADYANSDRPLPRNVTGGEIWPGRILTTK